MAEPVAAAMDAIGVLGFLTATFYGYRNWKTTRSLSQYWAVFAIAAGMGAVWAGSLTVEKLGYYPGFIDIAVGVLLGSMATAFAITALLARTDVVGPSH